MGSQQDHQKCLGVWDSVVDAGEITSKLWDGLISVERVG